MSKGRVLIVSYWFPPAGGIAVQRALSLAKYLPQYGCEVHVLAPANPPSPVLDPSLLAQIPANVLIHRAWTPSPPSRLRKRMWGFVSGGTAKATQPTQPKNNGSSHVSNFIRRVLSPDPEVAWFPFAVRRASQIVKKHAIDTVLVTAPPFSAFLIGNALKRKFPSLQLISDFRDEWLRFFLSTFEFQKSSHIRNRAESIERDTIELSDVVTCVTSSLIQELRERYVDQPAKKFVHIPNGYDPELFTNFGPRLHGRSKVVITYVGTVYSTTSPRCYFEALDALPESVRSRIETRFVGRIAEDQQSLLESRPAVQLIGYIPHTDALRYLEETDYLLLVLLDKTHATGKIYEYLASGKPILAFSPAGGEVARTIEETKSGWCIDPGDSGAAQDLLRRVATRETGAKFEPNRQAIRQYQRPRLAEHFAALILDASRSDKVTSLGDASRKSSVSQNCLPQTEI
jgi:glycosyltransferase involved in cell wall biosynthesis